MERRLRNRILIFLVLAGLVAYALIRVSGRQTCSLEMSLSFNCRVREAVAADDEIAHELSQKAG